MSGATCAKIIIDNYAALGGAAAGLGEAAEASCEALMQLVEEDRDLWAEAKPITEKCCYWAEKIDAWRKELNDAVRELAEKQLAKHDGGGKRASGEGL